MVIVVVNGVSRTITTLVTLGSLDSSYVYGTIPQWSHSFSFCLQVPCIQCESGSSWGALWYTAQWLLVHGRSLSGEAPSEELGHSAWSLTWSESAEQRNKSNYIAFWCRKMRDNSWTCLHVLLAIQRLESFHGESEEALQLKVNVSYYN